MSFTYTPGTDIGRIRLRLGDTVAESAVYSDEEIQAELTDRGSVASAALALARALYMRATRKARDYSGPDGSVNETAMLPHLAALVAQLEADAAEDDAGSTLPLAEVTDLGRAPNDPYWRT